MSAPAAVLLWGEDAFLLRDAALERLAGVQPVEIDARDWQGGETADLARAAGLRFEWQVRRYRDQARRFSLDELVRLHGRVVDADRDLKSGGQGDVVLAALVSSVAES